MYSRAGIAAAPYRAKIVELMQCNRIIDYLDLVPQTFISGVYASQSFIIGNAIFYLEIGLEHIRRAI